MGEREAVDYSTKHRWQNRARWTAASWINQLPGTCWANLVGWALHQHGLARTDDNVRQDSICRSDAAANGRCYCGKLEALAPTQPGAPRTETANERKTDHGDA